MANKNDGNIFKGLLDVLKQQKGLEPMQDGPPQSQAIFNSKGATSREEMQQQFLNWQVQRVSNDLYGRPVYFDAERISAYQDYRAMDHSPEVHQALNIMRDECLTPNEYGEILQVYSDQERVKEALKDLFTDKLNVNYMLKLWIREMLKYGDHFVYLKVDKDHGVVAVNNLPAAEVHREEGYDEDLGSVRFRWEGTSNIYFEEWQVAHFRLMENSENLPYGLSVLNSARKTWKQLQLAEDAMLVYRLVRSPDRKVFYVEVGNLDIADIGPYIQAMQKSVKKAPTADMRNGQREWKYNPQNVTEDYFLPVRGEHHSRIDTLPGASNMSDVQDIAYLENKLFCALVVPKAYLNYTEGLQGGTTLSQSDIRFARTIIGFQEVVLMELRKIAKVHLYLLGYEEDYENFTLKLNNPSTQMELMKLEIMKARLEVAKEWHSRDANAFASWTWVMENIMSFSKNDIKKMLKQKKVENKLFAEIDSAAETYRKTGIFKDIDQKYEIAGAPPEGGTGSEGGGEDGGGFNASSALGGDGGGGDFGGMDAGGDTPDTGGDASPAAPAAPAAPAPGGSAADMALGEGRVRKPDMESMMEELFEDDGKEEQKASVEKGKQKLVETGDAIVKSASTLFGSLEKKFGMPSLDDIRKRRDVIKETIFVESQDNPLLQRYNEDIARINGMIEDIEDGTNVLPDDSIIEEVEDKSDEADNERQ